MEGEGLRCWLGEMQHCGVNSGHANLFLSVAFRALGRNAEAVRG